MCCYYIDLNADIYPEPFKFLPERWLVNPPAEKWFLPFSKGSRSCIGIKLVPTIMFGLLGFGNNILMTVDELVLCTQKSP